MYFLSPIPTKPTFLFLLISLCQSSCEGSPLEEISSFIDFDCTIVLINLEDAQKESAEEAPLIFPNGFLQHFLPVTILLTQTHEEQLSHRRTISRLSLNSANCFQVVLNIPRSLSSYSPPLTTSLMSLISPVKNPSDHNFLLQNADRLLLVLPTDDDQDQSTLLSSTFSSPFVKSFKFKVALTVSAKKLSAFSSCNFCPVRFFPMKSAQEQVWVDFESNMNLHSLRLTASLTTRTRFNFSLIPSAANTSYRPTTGILVHFLSYLQQNLNFTFTLSPVGTPGVLLPNGSWTGAVSHILRGNADMAICIAETYRRAMAAHFSPTIFYEPVTLISGHPRKVFVWHAFLWPLSPPVWTLTVISSALSIAVLVSQVKSKKEAWGTGKIIEYVGGSLLGQFGAFPDNNRQKRFPPSILIFLTFWLIFSFIITAVYLSMLVGFLTFPVLEQIPETADQLAQRPEYSVGITYLGGALSGLMRTSKAPAIIKLSGRMQLKDAFQCIRTPTKDSKFICIGYEIIAKTFINTEGLLTPDGRLQKSPIQIHQSPLFAVAAGVLMPKGSPLIPNVAATVGSTLAAGLVPQWERTEFRKMRLKVLAASKIKTSTETDSLGDEANNDILTFEHLKGTFILLLLGLSLSLLALGIEFIAAKVPLTSPNPTSAIVSLVQVFFARIECSMMKQRQLRSSSVALFNRRLILNKQ